MKNRDDFEPRVKSVDKYLRFGRSYDLIKRVLPFAGLRTVFYMIDGLTKDETMQKLFAFDLALKPEQMENIRDINDFAAALVPYVEVDVTPSLEEFCTFVLSGAVGMLIEGFDGYLIIDARTYPARSTAEPEDDRVLRGSRDGFVETLVFNTALIRRRIRDPRLTVETVRVGSESKCDVAVCYFEGRADKKLLAEVKERIKNTDARSLAMSQQALAEALIRENILNPFPKVRYTERPDVAAATILEGSIVIVIDNTPSVMILPTSFFDFVREADDYYFPPFTGSYIRLVRIAVFLATLLITPTWYLLIRNPEILPDGLAFLLVEKPGPVPIIMQLIIVELAIDGLKMASLNTPSSLSGSFSIIGGLILGDFAVQARWLNPEVIVYMAFVAIANFAQPSFELGYAFKFMRMAILILTALFNYAGFFGGLIMTAVLVASNKTLSGKGYLYPVIPFDKADFARIFLRRRLHKD